MSDPLIDTLSHLVGMHVAAGVLAVHDGDLPYVFEIVSSRDPATYADLLARFPELLDESADMTGSFLSFSESQLNIDPVTGRIDAELPVPATAARLHTLLLLIGA